MDFTDLDEWKAYCQQAATATGDSGVLSVDWAGAGITPPPARGDLVARVPLDRALELADEAEGLEGDERRAKLEEAIAWLECPFPRTPPELLTAILRRRTALVTRASGDS
ncbi:MAG: hypothetical protein OEU54_00980 [Gemmatimonadota bacterium]|nr:hypothetical protein [Gemmatimonadota bacterium]